MNVILYSTHCPKCKVLESKLKEKNVSYEEVNDIKVMQEKGFEFVPMLEVDGEPYGFKQAIEWVGGQ